MEYCIYVGKEPKVNKVCFCFPFFLFFPDTISSVAGPIVEGVPPEAEAGELPPQTLIAGVPEGPKIFINDTLPLTGNLVLTVDDRGNSGKLALAKFGGAFAVL